MQGNPDVCIRIVLLLNRKRGVEVISTPLFPFMRLKKKSHLRSLSRG